MNILMRYLFTHLTRSPENYTRFVEDLVQSSNSFMRPHAALEGIARSQYECSRASDFIRQITLPSDNFVISKKCCVNLMPLEIAMIASSVSSRMNFFKEGEPTVAWSRKIFLIRQGQVELSWDIALAMQSPASGDLFHLSNRISIWRFCNPP